MIDFDTLRALGWSEELLGEVRRRLGELYLQELQPVPTGSAVLDANLDFPLAFVGPSSAAGSRVIAPTRADNRFTAT